jgi:hypothetical protein
LLHFPLFFCALSFRYAPLMPKQIMKFDVDGVQLSPDYVCNKQFCTIHLENLSRKTSGSYRCEISGDWPEFKLSHEESNLTVAGKWYRNQLQNTDLKNQLSIMEIFIKWKKIYWCIFWFSMVFNLSNENEHWKLYDFFCIDSISKTDWISWN